MRWLYTFGAIGATIAAHLSYFDPSPVDGVIGWSVAAIAQVWIAINTKV